MLNAILDIGTSPSYSIYMLELEAEGGVSGSSSVFLYFLSNITHDYDPISSLQHPMLDLDVRPDSNT
jgi:hypothetical protein